MKKLLALIIIFLMLPTSKVLAADTPPNIDNSKENTGESRHEDSLSNTSNQYMTMSNAKWIAIGNKDLYGHNKEDGTFELTGLMNELFFNIQNMLPGDTATKDIRIYNTSDKDYDLYYDAYRFDSQMPKEGEIDLLDVITLKITKTFNGATETIFDGKIFDENTNAMVIKLGTIKSKDEPILFEATVTMDPEAGNEYQNKEAEISWIFRAEGDEDTPPNPPDTPPNPPNPPDTPNPSDTPVNLNSYSGKGEYVGNVSKTGDQNHLIIYALLTVGSLTIGYLLFSKGKKRRKEQ